MNSATSGPDSAPPLSAGAGRYRWVICGLLFAATAVNYIDRQMIGVLKPTLQAEFGWNENAYSTIILWFQLAYALGYLSFGKIVDQIGARAGSPS
jgi:ACS family hexuronate transporter-like MFS transporter